MPMSSHLKLDTYLRPVQGVIDSRLLHIRLQENSLRLLGFGGYFATSSECTFSIQEEKNMQTSKSVKLELYMV